jgi:hypothetical protein
MVSKERMQYSRTLGILRILGETGFLKEGIDFLVQNKPSPGFNPDEILEQLFEKDQTPGGKAAEISNYANEQTGGGCPGSREKVLNKPATAVVSEASQSELRHWPVQMHLINPNAFLFP